MFAAGKYGQGSKPSFDVSRFSSRLEALSRNARDSFNHDDAMMDSFDINALPPTAAGIESENETAIEACIPVALYNNPAFMQSLSAENAVLPACEIPTDTELPPVCLPDFIAADSELLNQLSPEEAALPVCEPADDQSDQNNQPAESIEEQSNQNRASEHDQVDDEPVDAKPVDVKLAVAMAASLGGWKVNQLINRDSRKRPDSSRIEFSRKKAIMRWDEDSATLTDDEAGDGPCFSGFKKMKKLH